MEKNKKLPCAKMLLSLSISQTQSHFWHWQTGSFAQHMALGDYYGALPDLLDSFAETYIGHYGKFDLPEDMSISLNDYVGVDEMCDYFKELCKEIDTHYEMVEYGDLKNILDEIHALLNQTIYKLKNLS